jgi:cellulose synthase operon protein C
MLRRALPLIGLLLAVSVPTLAAGTALDEAVRYLRAGDARSARPALLSIVKADPANAMAHMLLARTYLQLNNGLSAEEEIKRAIEVKFPVARTYHLMGHALMLQGKPGEALAVLSRADIPQRYATYAARIRGRIHTANNNHSEALKAFDQALATGQNSSILWSDIARFRMNAGDVAGAIDATGRATQLDQRNLDAVMLSGELARGQYGLVAAVPWFERALEIDPGNVAAMLELAATLGDAGRAKDMLAMTRQVLAIDIKNPRAYYLQAVLAARAGKYDLARALLYRTNEKLEDVPSVILLRAILDVEADNDAQAITRLKKLVGLQPSNLKARRLLGAALSRSGDAEGAIEALRPIAVRQDADSYTLTLIGRAYETINKRDEAAWFLDRAGKSNRGDAAPFDIPISLPVLARANAENPNNADTAVPYMAQLIASGRAGEALAAAERLADQNPGAPAAHVLIGDSLMAAGRTNDAILAYKNAADIRFSEGTALRLVKALSVAGNDAEALQVLNLFLGQNPRSVPALLLIGDHFMATGQWDKAVATLENVRGRIGNRDASLLSNLSWSYLGKGDKGRAIAYAKAAYAIIPGNAAVANTYGWALFSTGHDKKMGLALLQKAVRQAPDHPGLQLRLGQAYAELGRKDDARRALKAAIAIKNFPGKKVATDLLTKLG